MAKSLGTYSFTGNAAKQIRDTSIGPWMQWHGLSRHARAIRFIETYCRNPKGYNAGQLIELADFQKEWLEEVIRDHIHEAVMQLPRGNGKSTLMAALAVWATFDPGISGDPQVPIIATTIKQAVKTLYGPATRMVQLEPELANRSKEFTALADAKIKVPFTNGEMFPIADDPDGLQGLDPSLGLIDEIGFMSMESWASLLLSTGKRPDSLIVAIGTPGFDMDNALWYIRKNQIEGSEDTKLHFTEFSADEGCDIRDENQWRKANPAYVAGFKGEHAFKTALSLPEGMFRIFQLGQWVFGTQSWLGPDTRKLWDALKEPYSLVAGADTWVGIDVAIKRDSTAVVAIQKRPDGRWHARAKFWVPTKDQPVDVTDVMQYIRQLDVLYNLREVSFDPRFFDVPAKQLLDEGITMVEIPQSHERMTGACGSTMELIKRAELTHDEDELFAAHICNAVPRFNERGFTLAKAKSSGRIDGTIALCLAVDRALHSKTKSPLVVL